MRDFPFDFVKDCWCAGDAVTRVDRGSDFGGEGMVAEASIELRLLDRA